ncbi:hypothetical protein PV325_007518 [Microctonus aethiopoides]|nr:hypothetical protein PV325_007518 [Microctonus aethiopoides]
MFIMIMNISATAAKVAAATANTKVNGNIYLESRCPMVRENDGSRAVSAGVTGPCAKYFGNIDQLAQRLTK